MLIQAIRDAQPGDLKWFGVAALVIIVLLLAAWRGGPKRRK